MNSTTDPRSILTRDASGAPVTFNRVRRITSHAGLSRYLNTVADTNHRIDRVAEIPSPYAYGPDHLVFRDVQDRLVFFVETAHKRYDVFQVPSGVKLFVLLPDDSKQYGIEVL